MCGSDNGLPTDASASDVSAYFWACLALGMGGLEASKEWAFSVVAALDAPSIAIIEIATASNRDAAMAALDSNTEGADWQTVGRWILAEVLAQWRSGELSALAATGLAMRAVQLTRLPESIYYEFDGIDENLRFATNGDFFTPAEIEGDLVDALERHSLTK